MMKLILIILFLMPPLLYFSLDYNLIPQTEYTVKNTSAKSIPLYKSADRNSSVVAYLRSGAKANYLYKSRSGRWIYIKLQTSELVVQAKYIELGYDISGIVFVDRNLAQIVAIVSSIIFMGIFLLYPSVKKRKKKEQHLSRQKQNYSVDEMNIYAQGKVEQVRKELTESHRIELDKLKINYEDKSQKLEEGFRTELIEKLMSELNINRAPTIENMISSVENLKKIYNEAVENALTFGIDLKHKRFESLLKGRLFEICIAKIVSKELNYTILEWTPDKGFDHEIFVQSNLNPDLILSDRGGNKVAIECKYRSFVGKIDGIDNSTSWSDVKQAERYLDFSKKRKIPVFLALGLAGDPSEPDIITIPPIDSILEASWLKDYRKPDEIAEGAPENPSYVCVVKKLDYWKIVANKPEIPWIKK